MFTKLPLDLGRCRKEVAELKKLLGLTRNSSCQGLG